MSSQLGLANVHFEPVLAIIRYKEALVNKT